MEAIAIKKYYSEVLPSRNTILWNRDINII